MNATDIQKERDRKNAVLRRNINIVVSLVYFIGGITILFLPLKFKSAILSKEVFAAVLIIYSFIRFYRAYKWQKNNY